METTEVSYNWHINHLDTLLSVLTGTQELIKQANENKIDPEPYHLTKKLILEEMTISEQYIAIWKKKENNHGTQADTSRQGNTSTPLGTEIPNRDIHKTNDPGMEQNGSRESREEIDKELSELVKREHEIITNYRRENK